MQMYLIRFDELEGISSGVGLVVMVSDGLVSGVCRGVATEVVGLADPASGAAVFCLVIITLYFFLSFSRRYRRMVKGSCQAKLNPLCMSSSAS